MLTNTFTLEESPINAAVDEIIAALRGVNDLDGNPVFLSVERGVHFEIPNESQMPGIRIWEEGAEYVQDTVEAFTKCTRSNLCFYLFMYQPAQDASGGAVDFQSRRNRLIRTFFTTFFPPYSGNAGSLHPHSDFWWWLFPNENERDIKIGVHHAKVFMNFGVDLPVLPPMYCTRIDRTIEAWITMPPDDRAAQSEGGGE